MTEIYDTPQPKEVPVRTITTALTAKVRELSAFEIARSHDHMLNVAVALYAQETLRQAVKAGNTENIVLYPMELLAAAGDSLMHVLRLSTNLDADVLEELSFDSMPAVIAAFVEANAPFFIDYVRRQVEAAYSASDAPPKR